MERLLIQLELEISKMRTLFVDWRALPILFESSELFLSPIFAKSREHFGK
jgi:hypothetical protein